ncbi:ligninase H2 [Xylariaceae sp. FL0016]|nr:ligninase H2 [Xylariaceae sp. FL0016]
MYSSLATVSFCASLLFSRASGFSDHPRMKQLAKIDAQNPIDLNTGGQDDGDDSFQLLGDLVNKDYATLSPTGRTIRDLLLLNGAPESDLEYINVPPLNSTACAQDTCCVWKYIADEMTDLFRGESGRCTRWARMAIRLGFHDAAAWSLPTADQGGGADGSICLTDEFTEAENSGLEDMCFQMRDWFAEWHDDKGWDISMADLIQMGANIATVVCPLGPRVRSFVGRMDDATPNQSKLLPSALAPADELIRLFRDKTISPHQLVALVGAHTTSQQSGVNASRAGDPQDSTPGVWDVLFYEQTFGAVETPNRVFQFPSDLALAKDSVTADEWSTFLGDAGQDHWNMDYSYAYIRMSLMGVNNINNLTECTRALPRRTAVFKNPDQQKMNVWLESFGNTPAASEIAETVEAGDTINSTNGLTARALGHSSRFSFH